MADLCVLYLWHAYCLYICLTGWLCIVVRPGVLNNHKEWPKKPPKNTTSWLESAESLTAIPHVALQSLKKALSICAIRFSHVTSAGLNVDVVPPSLLHYDKFHLIRPTLPQINPRNGESAISSKLLLCPSIQKRKKDFSSPPQVPKNPKWNPLTCDPIKRFALLADPGKQQPGNNGASWPTIQQMKANDSNSSERFNYR